MSIPAKVTYPEGMDISPIRAAILSCSDEDALALTGHAMWAQSALALARGDVQEISWYNRNVWARVRAKGVTYRSSIECHDSAQPADLRLKCSCFLEGACVHAAALLQKARQVIASERTGDESSWKSECEVFFKTNGADSLGLIIDAHDPSDFIWLIPVRFGRGKTKQIHRLSWAELAQSQWNGVVDVLAPKHLEALRRLYQYSRKSQGFPIAGYDVHLESLGVDAPRWLYQLQCYGIALLTPELMRFHFSLQDFRRVLDMNRVGKNLEISFRTAYGEPWAQELSFPRAAPEVALTFYQGGQAAQAKVNIEVSEDERKEVLSIPQRSIGDFIHEYLPLLRARFECISSMGTFPIESCSPSLCLHLRTKDRLCAEIVWSIDFRIGDQHFNCFLSPQTTITQLDDTLRQSFEAAHAILRGYFPSSSLRPSAQSLLIPLPQVPALIESISTWSLPSVTWKIEDDLKKLQVSEETAVIKADIAATGSPDWWGLHVTVHVGDEEIPISRVLKALSAQEDYLRLANGRWVRLEGVDIERLRVLLRAAAHLTRSRSVDDIRLHPSHVGVWETLREVVDTTSEDSHWRERTHALRKMLSNNFNSVEEVGHPYLRPYQLYGRQWLLNRIYSGFGCVLADDMGLGKTRQVLAAIDALRERAPGNSPVLIVVPTSVLSSWTDEAECCFPQLRVLLLSATHKRAPAAWKKLSEVDVVITSHTLFRIDHEHWHKSALRGVVIDEAQAVKNPRTLLYRSLKDLDVPWRICMSGTPIENSLDDLWALMSLSVPGLLSSHASFNERFRRPIEGQGKEETSELLRTLISPFVLRRTKESVAPELPDRVETLIPISLQGRQRQIYDRYLTRERARLLHLHLSDEPNQERFEVLAALTRLRQLSLDPALVDERYEGVGSAKIDVLCSHLEQIVPAGHKVLVFSQFVRFLERIREVLSQRGIATALLDGKTRRRQEVINRFRNGEASVFLISLKAGGVGLTLTEADYVYMMDPWWNPSVEAQAINRAHRIGQNQKVNVYRFVAQDTVEEKVCQLQAHKQLLIESIVDGVSGTGGRSLDLEQLLELFGEQGPVE